MDQISFDIVATAWKRLINNPDKVNDMQIQAPTLTKPAAIRLKNQREDEITITIRFFGFNTASEDSEGIPIIKRMIFNWVKRFSQEVQIMDSIGTDLILVISKTARFTEAAISIYRRDPKTNKVKRVYKCIGGRKDGRRVSDPELCLQYPDVAKRISLSISKRAKHGQSRKAKTKTKLTNIVARRVRKANQRLKKARGI